MSDHWLNIIPSDPAWVPDPERKQALAAATRDLAPEADSVELVGAEDITFVHAGADFESVTCPRCTGTLDLGWWSEQMDLAWTSRFTDLDVVVPCCAERVNLNDLSYDPPQGFAGWWVEVTNPGRGPLEASELRHLGAVLGHEVRDVWTHL